MDTKRTEVAIIGAGLAGTLLALSLSIHSPQHSPITIYESRPPNSPEIASGLILTPNGLHILQKLGVFDRIKDICWTNEYRTYVNDQDEITKRVLVASESLYGFRNHRLYRRVMLQIIKDMCEEHGVAIKYSQRYEGILKEDENGVDFSINNTTHHADLLIGADGIYSSVRKHIDATIQPEYTGTLGVLAHIQWSTVAWPPTFNQSIGRQCTIQGQPGAFFMIPETRDGEDVMVGMQVKHPAQTRTEWENLARDRQALTDFFRRDYDAWHPTARGIIDAATSPPALSTLYMWPYLRMPRLPTWSSPAGRVVLIGDAAHAIPPSSGQGVNQALEDIWTLTLLLRPRPLPRPETLAFWHLLRQRRVDAVYDWATNATNVQRMPADDRQRLLASNRLPDPLAVRTAARNANPTLEFFDDMRWLYVCSSESEIQSWIAAQNVSVGG